MTTPLAALFTGNKPPVKRSPDLARILALPRRPPVEPGTATAEALINLAVMRYGRGPRQCRCAEIQRAAGIIPKPCIKRPNYVQAWALHECATVGGMLGNIAVGGGKTFIDVMAAMALPNTRCAVLLVPSGLVRQLSIEYDLIAEHFVVPSMHFHAGPKSPASRQVPNAPVVHVLPYSRFQRSESTVFLDRLKPDTLIIDEAQNLASMTSTRSSRYLRFMAAYPDTAVVAMSGTLTDDEIQDYCVDPSTLVLTADLRWVRADEVTEGLSLVGFDETLGRTKLRESVVERVKVIKKRRIRLVTSAGDLICSDDHLWVLRGRTRTFTKARYTQLGNPHGTMRWVSASDVRPGDLLGYCASPWGVDDTRLGGYMAGLLDGEGWVSRSIVGFGQKEGEVLDAYITGLKELGFDPKVEPRPSGVTRVYVNGGQWENMRLLGSLQPKRLLNKSTTVWRGHIPAASARRVLRVEELPPDDVVAIQTSTRTFVANGFLSHNCHHADFALKDGSPLPRDPDVCDEWGDAINPAEWVAPPGALVLLCNPDEHVQDGFHRRVVETPGVVATKGASIDAEMEILERSVPNIPEDVARLLLDLRATWTRPDGEELLDALSVARCARELACGLYLKWRFPRGESESLIREWKDARKAWRQELRKKLARREPHLDSPMLCANAAMRAWGSSGELVEFDESGDPYEDAETIAAITSNPDLPLWKAETWPRWHAVKGLVRPVTQAVRVNDFLARDAATWASQNLGIVWYVTVAFGSWVSELSGLTLHGGGQGADERIAAERGDRSIIASIKSHGTGRDGLQRLFHTQLVTQPPASAVGWEQLLGRLSRIGQEADRVEAWVYRHTPEVRECTDAALRKALYVQRTWGSEQKLRAGWRIAA